MQRPIDQLLNAVRSGAYPEALLDHVRLATRWLQIDPTRDIRAVLPPDFPTLDYLELLRNPLSEEDRDRILKETPKFMKLVNDFANSINYRQEETDILNLNFLEGRRTFEKFKEDYSEYCKFSGGSPLDDETLHRFYKMHINSYQLLKAFLKFKIHLRSVNGEGKKEYEHYLAVAEQKICDEALLDRILYTWDTIRRWIKQYRDCKNFPFIFVGGPSLIGKTQLAITLDALSKFQFGKDAPAENYKILACLHFSAASLKSLSTQPIQHYIRSQSSELIHYCFDVDFPVLRNSNPDLTVAELVAGPNLPKDEKLRAVGLIMKLVEVRLGCSEKGLLEGNDLTLYCDPMSINVARKKILEMTDDEFPLIACLDDFSAASTTEPESLAKLTLLRNIIREIGIVTIVMGTDPDAVNIIDPMPLSLSGSRAAEYPIWCRVVTSLPAPRLGSIFLRKESVHVDRCICKERLDIVADHQMALEAFPRMRAKFASDHDYNCFMNWIFKNDNGTILSCRNPGILEIFLQHAYLYLQNNTGLTALHLLTVSLKESLKHLKDLKLSKYPQSKDLGQFAILFSFLKYVEAKKTSFRYGQDRDKEYYPSSLVHHHFASLKIQYSEGHIECLEQSVGSPLLRMSSGHNLFLRSGYEDISIDELTRLILGGLCEQNNYDAFPRATVYLWLRELNSGLGLELLDLFNVVSRESLALLEILGLAAAIIASHKSLSGLSLLDYIAAYLKEFSDDPNLNLKWSENIGFLSDFQHLVVPYLPCVDDQCSNELALINGVYAGVLKSTQNSEMGDNILVPDVVEILHRLSQANPHDDLNTISEPTDKLILENLKPVLGGYWNNGRFQIFFEYKHYSSTFAEDSLLKVAIRACGAFDRVADVKVAEKLIMIVLVFKMAKTEIFRECLDSGRASNWFAKMSEACPSTKFALLDKDNDELSIRDLGKTGGSANGNRIILIVPIEQFLSSQ